MFLGHVMMNLLVVYNVTTVAAVLLHSACIDGVFVADKHEFLMLQKITVMVDSCF